MKLALRRRQPPPPPGRLRGLSEIYRFHFEDERRERMFISSLTFFGGFAGVRALTHAIRRNLGPFHNISRGGVHIHHAVWGISLLLLVGYLWDAQIGTGSRHPAASRVLSALYGLGSALTLDEFALWLNLQDVYWAKQGRESIDAVVLFGALSSVTWWGGPFLEDFAREISRLRHPHQVAQLAR